MQRNILISIILPLFPIFTQMAGSCRQGNQTNIDSTTVYGDKLSSSNPYPAVGAIPTPAGYHRIPADTNSFTAWLRHCPLKKNRTVYLFNGAPKSNQDAQFAVLDISVGNTDLQQCADAVMRLRAEFLYAHRNFVNIDFYTDQATRINFLEWANGRRFKLRHDQLAPYTLPVRSVRLQSGSDGLPGSAGVHAGEAQHHSAGYCEDRSCFQEYLQTVFAYCGTRSLERQLIPVSRFQNMQIGDVLVHGGSPGHAMLVIDMAEDKWGHKIFLLAQSYMPAQDIHIVKNIYNPSLSPWYRVDESEGPTTSGGNTPAGDKKTIYTPEWTFYSNQLRTWPKLVGKL